MFVLDTTPGWATALDIVGGIVLLFGLVVIGVATNSTSLGRTILIFLGSLASVVGAISLLVGMANLRSIENTFNNPNAIDADQRKYTNVNVSKVEEEIASALGVNKVQIDEKDNNGIYNSRKILKGDMVDFTAVDEGKISAGSFYFTTSTLEILTTDETDLVENVSVPTK